MANTPSIPTTITTTTTNRVNGYWDSVVAAAVSTTKGDVSTDVVMEILKLSGQREEGTGSFITSGSSLSRERESEK